jgi:hypothetical protein
MYRKALGDGGVFTGCLPYLINTFAMKAYAGVEVYLYAFLTEEIYGGERSASRPGRRTHRIGKWAGSRAGLWDRRAMKKKYH